MKTTTTKKTERCVMPYKSPEEIALEFSFKRANLTKRFRDYCSFWGLSSKGMKIDVTNKTATFPCGTVLHWQTRELPEQPIHYHNQQTTVGVVRLVTNPENPHPLAK